MAKCPYFPQLKHLPSYDLPYEFLLVASADDVTGKEAEASTGAALRYELNKMLSSISHLRN